MAISPLSPYKTLSRWQVARLENLGATVSATTVTATRLQLVQAGVGPSQRIRLEKRGNLALE